jgi:hypothetical protein
MEHLIGLILLLVLLGAYLVNIVRLVKAQEINGLTLARVVGIFVFPLGALLGFIRNKGDYMRDIDKFIEAKNKEVTK